MFFHQALDSHGVPDFERPGDLLVIVQGNEATLIRVPVVRTIYKRQPRNRVDNVLQCGVVSYLEDRPMERGVLVRQGEYVVGLDRLGKTPATLVESLDHISGDVLYRERRGKRFDGGSRVVETHNLLSAVSFDDRTPIGLRHQKPLGLKNQESFTNRGSADAEFRG